MRKRKSHSRKIVKATVHRYSVLFEPALEGGYTVTVPALPGVITEGDSIAQARDRVREAIAGYLKVLRKHGEPLPMEGKARLRRPVVQRVAVSV